MTDEQAQKFVDVLVHQLGEHFDAVQVMATWRGEGTSNTLDIFAGTGNWYARQGMAYDFIQRDRAQTSAHEIASQLNGDDEDDDPPTIPQD